MKLLSNFKSGLLKAMVAAFAICPAAVSCYDDSALQEQIDMLVDKVYELETRLTSEIEALQNMLKGKACHIYILLDNITIECKKT